MQLNLNKNRSGGTVNATFEVQHEDGSIQTITQIEDFNRWTNSNLYSDDFLIGDSLYTPEDELEHIIKSTEGSECLLDVSLAVDLLGRIRQLDAESISDAAQNRDLEIEIQGLQDKIKQIMTPIDEWLNDEDELSQDVTSRARTVREKTLSIIKTQQESISKLHNTIDIYKRLHNGEDIQTFLKDARIEAARKLTEMIFSANLDDIIRSKIDLDDPSSINIPKFSRYIGEIIEKTLESFIKECEDSCITNDSLEEWVDNSD